MKKRLSFLLLVTAALLAACTSGPVRRVSEPAASIQQLTVEADGSWSVDLRLQNYSSITMRFDRVRLEMQVNGEAAGTLDAAPQLQISQESADVISISLAPSSQARLLLADALASGRGVSYSLVGSASAAPTDRGSVRDYPIKREGVLSPMPGLPGVLR
ncbi:MAG TPA: hypothetical protein H9827_07525 [Candidatus Luteimonas excrementigallinarum]|nr:hypothetical protein [Candidatus Luteimonas excrementigallinarum]